MKLIPIMFTLCCGTVAYHCDRTFDSGRNGEPTKLHCIEATLKDVVEEKNSPQNLTSLILFRPPNSMKTLNKKALEKCTNLRNFILIRSNVRNLPEQVFENNRKLFKFRIQTNSLTTLPRNLLGNSDLRILTLMTNLLSVPVNEPILESTNLQVLQLPSSKIRVIYRETFQKLPNLNSLDLKKNQLEKIPHGAFENLPFLRMLRLEGNRLKSLDLGSFMENYDRKIVLLLRKNPWQCDCQLLPLMNWDLGRIDFKKTKCRSPKMKNWLEAKNNLTRVCPKNT